MSLGTGFGDRCEGVNEAPTTDKRVAWAESLLWRWSEEWPAVAERVGVEWHAAPLEPCDQENFLCIYQERR